MEKADQVVDEHNLLATMKKDQIKTAKFYVGNDDAYHLLTLTELKMIQEGFGYVVQDLVKKNLTVLHHNWVI